MWISWTFRLLALSVVLLSACGTRARGSGPKGSSADTPVARALIGANGGTLTLSQGPARGAKIVIPAGALTKPVTITMRTMDAPDDLPPRVRLAGPVVDFGPEGQR